MHRADVLAECRRLDLCGAHEVAVEVERTSNLIKDAESLNSTGADVKYVVLLTPRHVPSTFGDFYVVQLEGFEASLRQVLEIDRRDSDYQMFRPPRLKLPKNSLFGWMAAKCTPLMTKTHTPVD